MISYLSRVSEHTILAAAFHFLRLELVNPHQIEFRAGQFISLLVDKTAGYRRNYSIASPPSLNHALELLVDVSPQGPGSRYIQNLKPGDRVEFSGPLGSLVIDNYRLPAADYQLLFAATGCGIAPIRSMIFDQLIRRSHLRPIRLWWGMRYQEDCFWEEDFDVLEKENPNFKWDLVLSKPPAGWPLPTGHVTSRLIDYVNKARHPDPDVLNNLQFYVCGNQKAVGEISTKLKETGINENQIHFEKFF